MQIRLPVLAVWICSWSCPPFTKDIVTLDEGG